MPPQTLHMLHCYYYFLCHPNAFFDDSATFDHPIAPFDGLTSAAGPATFNHPIASVDGLATFNHPIAPADGPATFNHPIAPADGTATLEEVKIGSIRFTIKLDQPRSTEDHLAADFVLIRELKHYQSLILLRHPCLTEISQILSNHTRLLAVAHSRLYAAVRPCFQRCIRTITQSWLFDRFRLLAACAALLLTKFNKLICFFYFICRLQARQYSVSTLAGSGDLWADGTGTSAVFNNPHGVAVDTFGNVFVADTSNHRIRRVTLLGAVSTLAGSGAARWADGTGTAAKFKSPNGVALDAYGNVFVADTSNHRIRMVTSLGAVSTLAGSGSANWADGTGTSAMFCYPRGVVLDTYGNVFVADTSNHRIRMVTSLGVVSTLAGSGSASWADGTGTSAMFCYPNGVAVDDYGNVFVADSSNHCIRMVTSLGVVSMLLCRIISDGLG